MSRESVESLSVVAIAPGSRQPPPPSLGEEEAAEWRQICASKPAEWFSAGDGPLLEHYCRLIVETRRLGLSGNDGKEFIEKSRLMIAHARSLRLTQQARYTPDKAAVHARRAGNTSARPWETPQSG